MKLQLAYNKDINQIMTFYHDVITFTDHIYEELKWEENYHPSKEEVSKMINRQQFYLLFDHDQIIGAFGLTYQDESYQKIPFTLLLESSQVGVVHLLAIHPHFTNQGYGKKLIQNIFKLAKELHYTSIRLDVIHSNRKATYLYTKMGFQYVTSRLIELEGIGNEQFDYYEFNL